MVDLAANSNVLLAVKNTEEKLGDQGRVLLRASGTEPVVRVMVEGKNAELTDELAKELASTIETILQS
jgi:phosphoglucosamine mutase